MKKIFLILGITSLLLNSCVKEFDNVGSIKAQVVLYDSFSNQIFDYSKVNVSFVGKTEANKDLSREIIGKCNSNGEFEFGNLVNNSDYKVTVKMDGFESVTKVLSSSCQHNFPLDSFVLRQKSSNDYRLYRVKLFDSSIQSISNGKLYLFDTKSSCNIENVKNAVYDFDVKHTYVDFQLKYKTSFWILASYVDQYNNTYFSIKKELRMNGIDRFYSDTFQIRSIDNRIQKLNVQCQLNSGILKNSLVYLINANKPFNLKDTSNALQKGYVNSQGKVSFSGLNKGQLLYVVAFNRYNNTLFSDSTVIQIGKNSVYNINKLHRVLNLENKIFPNYGYRFFVSIEPNTTEGIYKAKVYLYKSSIVMNADSNFTKAVDVRETDKNGNVVFDDLDDGESYFIKAHYKLNETEYVNVPIQQTVKILDATEIKLILIKQ